MKLIEKVVKIREGIMNLYDGQKISCWIDGSEVKDCRIRRVKNVIYACQNVKSGCQIQDKDRWGYKYSWALRTDEVRNGNCGVVTNIVDLTGKRVAKGSEDNTPMQLLHMGRISCYINDGFISDAILSIDTTGEVFICQNFIPGMKDSQNMFGYKFARSLGINPTKGSVLRNNVYGIKYIR